MVYTGGVVCVTAKWDKGAPANVITAILGECTKYAEAQGKMQIEMIKQCRGWSKDY